MAALGSNGETLMIKEHIAFIVESAHGHINPTLPIASKLVERGYLVSYAVKEYFAFRVLSVGAKPKVYRPLETKLILFAEMERERGRFLFDFDHVDYAKAMQRADVERSNTLEQLKVLYDGDRPDLIICDMCNPAGRDLAREWNIPTAEHLPDLVDHANVTNGVHDSDLVLVSIPSIFQRNSSVLDSRFRFVGPLYNDGRFFEPWSSSGGSEPHILVSATTGLLPRAGLFSTAIEAFVNTTFHVVLSIGDDLDPRKLPSLAQNFEINTRSSQQEILRKCSLFICHGGTSSVLESLRFGVPLIVIPPSQAHDVNATRIAELGVGIRMMASEMTAEKLKRAAIELMNDSPTLRRVKDMQQHIRALEGPELAADLIEKHINKNSGPRF